MGEQVAETFNFARDVMEQWAKRRPHDPALWCVDEAGAACRYSFAELADRFRRACDFLHKAGIRCGDRVLVMLPRVPAWWIGMLGLIRLGAVPIPTTTLLTAKDIAYRVQAAGITAILTDADGATKVVRFEGIVILDNDLETGLEKAAADFEPAPTRADDPSLVYFTSGTTGPPKMVLHTQALRPGTSHHWRAMALLQAARRALEPR
jgi:acyl-coenzyme A synthetase/AMP-(fatty) acid ligase